MTTCPRCGGRLTGHGTRERHVIENGVKIWFRVRRRRCKDAKCKTSCTQLLPNMLPHKHYCAADVEEVLRAAETHTPTSELQTTADESTLRRWRNEFSAMLDVLSGTLESIATAVRRPVKPLLQMAKAPLARLREAVTALEELPAGWTYLSRAYFWRRTHPLCLG